MRTPLIALSLVACLSGCATIERTCDEHGEACAISAAVIVGAAAILVAHKMSPRGVQVRQNQPNAPITPPTGCALTNTCDL